MLKRLKLKNFKGIKDEISIEIDPLTLFSGANSSGKSTIIQSILFIKQSLANDSSPVTFRGEYVDLLDFKHAIYEENLEEEISIEFEFFIKKRHLSQEYNLVLENIINRLLPISIEEFKDDTTEFNYSFKVNIKTTKTEEGTIENDISKLTLSLYSHSKTQEKQNHLEFELNFKKSLSTVKHYTLSWKNFPLRKEDSNLKNASYITISTSIRGIFPGKNFSKKISNGQDISKEDFNEVLDAFHRFQDLVETTFSRFRYIGPLRSEPNYDYEYKETNGNTLDISAKKAPSIYYEEKQKSIHLKAFFDFKTNRFVNAKKNKPEAIDEILNAWLSLMNIKGFSAEINRASNKLVIYLHSNLSDRENFKVRIPQAGFGVSQIYPALLESLRAQPGETVIIEQPEAHLNPTLQMIIADFFLYMALNDRRFIVETHSEHFMYRLLRRFAEDGISDERYSAENRMNIKSKVNMYFIEQSSNGTQARKVLIDTQGFIEEWPSGFFDQGIDDKDAIIEAMNIKNPDLLEG